MKYGITSHLVNPKQTQLVVAKDTICMLASGSLIANSRGVVKVLGVDKKNIRKALE
jgi:hypothetical protein